MESYKQVITTPTVQKYNNYNNSFEHKLNTNIPTVKLNPIKIKKMEKNNFNLFLQNINTFAPNKINKTKNKFLNEINHYLKDSEDKKENNIKYPRISMSQRYQKNKPILPVIKTNIIGQGDKLTHHVLTEANNKNTRNIISQNYFNNIKNYSDKNSNLFKIYASEEIKVNKNIDSGRYTNREKTIKQSDKAVKSISEYISKFLPQNITNISNESIKSAFIQTQNSLLSENTKIDSSLSGTTCTSVIISQDKIIIANLGDSRAIISLYESGIYNTINLSHDHNLKEPKEMKRILNNGGVIRQYTDEKGGYIGPERVFLKNSEIPGLAMSRTFGDSIAHGIGVISEPEIFEYNYKGSEKFIVIATDGIWEFIDSDECSKIVGEFYENNMDAVGGLNALVKEAFKRWKYQENNVDDITAILIFFE